MKNTRETVSAIRAYFDRNRRWLSAALAAVIFIALPELLSLLTSSPAMLYPAGLLVLILVLLSGYLGYALMTTNTQSAKIIRYLGSAAAVAVVAGAYFS